MPFSINELKYRYSGGAANSDPLASLGGIRSSVAVLSQTTSLPVNVTGVTISYATNNAQGTGLLSWSPSTNTLSWQPPGSAYVYSVSGVIVSGEYTVGGTDGTLVLNVVVGSLAGVYKQDAITVSRVSGNVFDAVAALDSLVGNIEYRCLYVHNISIYDLTNLRIWIKQLTTGPDEIDIGLDPAGVGDGSSTGVATVIANSGIAPSGVSFSRPLTYNTGLVVGDLPAGTSAAFWERRTVPANTTGDIAANTSVIGVAFSV
jgi:hypothetical protein